MSKHTLFNIPYFKYFHLPITSILVAFLLYNTCQYILSETLYSYVDIKCIINQLSHNNLLDHPTISKLYVFYRNDIA